VSISAVQTPIDDVRGRKERTPNSPYSLDTSQVGDLLAQSPQIDRLAAYDRYGDLDPLLLLVEEIQLF
jgi:hypothetical protein